jgi:hypothetical protein
MTSSIDIRANKGNAQQQEGATRQQVQSTTTGEESATIVGTLVRRVGTNGKWTRNQQLISPTQNPNQNVITHG